MDTGMLPISPSVLQPPWPASAWSLGAYAKMTFRSTTMTAGVASGHSRARCGGYAMTASFATGLEVGADAGDAPKITGRKSMSAYWSFEDAPDSG